MVYIYRENYSEEIYNEFYNFFEKRVDTISDFLDKHYPKNECFELEYGYDTWVENTYIRAMESTGLQVECYDLQVEIEKNLQSDFSQLQDEIDYHNERALELQYNER